MSKESLNSSYANLIFRETFRDEQATRKNGITPTDVSFKNGVGSFNGSSSYIYKKINLKGTYSLRVRFKSITPSISYMFDFRSLSNTNTGYSSFDTTSTFHGSSGACYIDSVKTQSYTKDTKEIVISGINLDTDDFYFGKKSYFNTNYLNAEVEFFEIYKGTLTPSEISNLYNNTWNKELTGMGGQASSGNLVKNGFDWIDSNNDGLAANWNINKNAVTPKIYKGQRITYLANSNYFNYRLYQTNIFNETGKKFIIKFKAKGNGKGLNIKLKQGTGASRYVVSEIALTNEFKEFVIKYTVRDTSIYNTSFNFEAITVWTSTDDWFEVSDVTVKELNPKTLIDFNSTNGVLEDKQVSSVVGDDLVNNGTFDTNSDWTYASCWSISNGKAHFDTSGVSGSINQVIGLESGKKYKLIFTISNNTNGRLGIYSNIGALIGYTEYINGNHVVEFTGDGGTTLKFYGHTNYQSFDLDNVQLYEIRDDLAVTDVVVNKNGALFNGSTSKINTGTDMIETKAVTVMGWIKPYSWGEDRLGCILQNNNNSDGFTLRLQGVSIFGLQYTKDFSTYTNSSTNSITLNKLQFITVTRKSDGIVNFYIGDKKTAPVLSGNADQDLGTPVAGTTNAIIGNNSGATRTFDGLINKLKVIEGILNLSEITRYWSSSRKEIQ